MIELMGFISKKVSPCVMFRGRLCQVFDMTSDDLVECGIDLLSNKIRNNLTPEDKKELSILCNAETHAMNF